MKKLIMVCVAVIIVLILASCKAPEGGLQAAFLCGAVDSDIFNSNTAVLLTDYKKYIDDSVEKTASIRVNDQIFELTYDNTVEQGAARHSYKTKDGKISCYYFDTNKKLAQITIKDDRMNLLSVLSTEEEFLSWIESFLKQFGVDNLSDYEYSCETGIVVSGDDFTYMETISGFHLANENRENSSEEVMLYSFYYCKELGGIRTSDGLTIFIFDGMIIVKFDEKRFADMDAPIQDAKAYDKIVEEFLKNSISEKYTLVSYEVGTPRLTYIEEKLCFEYAVDAELKNNALGGTIATVFSVAVDVNAISK